MSCPPHEAFAAILFKWVAAMTCTPVECSATKEGATDGLPSTASRTDTPDLPADFEPYTQSTYLLIDPVGSPVDADSAWARITLDDTGTISVARALLPLLSLRFGTPYQTTSVQLRAVRLIDRPPERRPAPSGCRCA
jgi:hypothetical protein